MCEYDFGRTRSCRPREDIDCAGSPSRSTSEREIAPSHGPWLDSDGATRAHAVRQAADFIRLEFSPSLAWVLRLATSRSLGSDWARLSSQMRSGPCGEFFLPIPIGMSRSG